MAATFSLKGLKGYYPMGDRHVWRPWSRDCRMRSRKGRWDSSFEIISLPFTGPPVPITARVRSAPRSDSSFEICRNLKKMIPP
eukprot:46505-Prorocentrum_minimum.AAC.1